MAVMVVAGSSLGDSLFADPSVVSALLERLSGLNSEEDAEPMTAMIQSLGALKSPEAVSALQSMLQDRDRTVALEAAKALESITSKSFVHEVSASDKPLHTDYDWEFLGNLSGAVVDVETSSGTFSFEMLPGNAPFTCVNFARLIDSGFYGGLRFHRVVSNFVIQGGDPRGDGWGGPGYTIRSEFGLEHYEAGMVGVASSGKDTEGCQFFVTHSKQPHLDGRYTIFGRITRGMDVVDRIQVGDGIAKVRVVRRRNGE
jgi:peptidylprolyl isomerase